jgi:hypothetical protein
MAYAVTGQLAADRRSRPAGNLAHREPGSGPGRDLFSLARPRNRPEGGTGRRGRTPPRCWIHAHAAISLTPAASAAEETGRPS